MKCSWQRQLTYKTATIAGLTTNIFFGLLRVAVMVALYRAKPEAGGMSLPQAITYTGLTQAIIAYLSIFGWYEIINSVYQGDVAADLLKPIDYFMLWLAQDVGRALLNLLLRGGGIMLFYILFFNITYPVGLIQWSGLLCSLTLGLLVSFGWRFLVNMSAFFTPNAAGVGRFAFGLAWVLSGFFMPLRFFPAWFVNLCQLTPFPAMVNTPVEIYLGLLTGTAMLKAIAEQAVWLAILLVLGQLSMHLGVKKLVIQGG